MEMQGKYSVSARSKEEQNSLARDLAPSAPQQEGFRESMRQRAAEYYSLSAFEA